MDRDGVVGSYFPLPIEAIECLSVRNLKQVAEIKYCLAYLATGNGKYKYSALLVYSFSTRLGTRPLLVITI